MAGEKNRGSRARPKAHAVSICPSRPQNIKGSSILHCAFTPSHFRQPLFASVVHELDSQHVRVHDTRSRRTLCSISASSTASVTCLDWGRHWSKARDEFSEPSRKKRRIYTGLEDQHTLQDGVAIAYGTNESRIHLVSPTEGKVVVTLDGGHTLGIRDFKFLPADDYQTGWSLGGDGNLVQWNLKKIVNIRIIHTADISATTLLPAATHIFYASHTVHRVDLADTENRVNYNASTSNVLSMVLSSPEADGKALKLLTSTHSSSHMLVFDLSSANILATLVAQSNIVSLSYLPATRKMKEGGQNRSVDLLAVVTADQQVEIFTDPFNALNLDIEHGRKTPKLGNKAQVKRSSAAVQLQRQTKTQSPVRILMGSLDENALLVAWVEDGINVCFEEIPCMNQASGEFILSGAIVRPVVDPAIDPHQGVGSARELGSGKRTSVDESHAIVLQGGNIEIAERPSLRTEVIDISSAVETDSSDDEVNDLHLSKQPQYEITKKSLDKNVTGNSEPKDQIESGEAPSFGELIAAAKADPIEVAAIPANGVGQDLITSTHRSARSTMNLTFSTLLPQALGTNDNILLERCLHVTDTNMVRATIERLNPAFAAALLQNLADRLHGRPGRAGTLLVWIQWTLVAHGGYLGTQIANIHKLGALYRAVRERANSLQPLLSLKGKLDMLEAQTNMRKSIQQRLGKKMIDGQIQERTVVSIEGQDEADSEDDPIDKTPGSEKGVFTLSRSTSPMPIDNYDLKKPFDDIESEDQGFDEVSSADETNPLFDLEASESDQNTGESPDEEVNYEDVDSADGEERSAIEESSRRVKIKSGIVNGFASKIA